MQKTAIPSETLIFVGHIWRTKITKMSIRVRHKVNYMEVFSKLSTRVPAESPKSEK